MAEAVYNAAGLGLPIVMTIGNRAIGAPINIWNDHSDSMSMRDAGWIQLYAETNQEALDLHIIAFWLAEELSCPVMVCVDGFILTHACDRIDMPTRPQVDAFLPPFEPRQVLDPDEPVSMGAMVGPEAFTEVRYLAHHKQLRALKLIPQLSAVFKARFGRSSGGLVKPYSLNSGHRACQGCGEALGARYAIDAAMRAAGNQLIAADATGCLEVFSTPYPETSWQIPWIHSLFGNAAAVASGIVAALRVRGRSNVRVIAQGGDGGTTDIGFGCLSGMFERNDDVLYVCYDNEAYMNTGVQRSSATPPTARTAATAAVGAEPGKSAVSATDTLIQVNTTSIGCA